MSPRLDSAIRQDEVVRPAPGFDLTRATLTVQEGFVFSRVDGSTTVATLCAITGLGGEATLSTLESLWAKGALKIGDRAPPQADPAPSGGTSNDGAKQATVSTFELGSVDDLPPEDVAALEQEDADGADLKRDLRVRIRLFRRRLAEMSFFELLGVSIDSDMKSIRRGYFARSKEFHPDRYYSKQLGPYKGMLAEVFRQISAAYEFLQDEGQREAYRQNLQEQRQGEALSQRLERYSDGALRDFEQAEPTASGSADRPVVAVSPARELRERRNSGGVSLRQQNIRERLRSIKTAPGTGGYEGGARPLEPVPTGPPAPPADDAERQERRGQDRERILRARRRTISGVAGQRQRKAREHFELGLRQVEEGKVLAAAASLKLAATYDPENVEYARKSEEAASAAKAVTADSYFKRAVFEESVGRYETAAHYYAQAASTHASPEYVRKAAEALLASGNLVNAREYVTKAVQVDPGSADTRLTAARVYKAAGQLEHARRELELALKIEPKLVEAKELLKKIKRS